MPGFGVDRGSGSSTGSADGAIGEAIIDAKGDLIAGTAADTAGRLAVGADNTRLVADAAEATGLKWVADTQNTVVDAKGDLLVGTAADTVARLAVGTNEKRLVADSAQASGLAYVADTTNYAVAAKGDLLAGTAADTVAPLTVGSDDQALLADSSTATGLRWGGVPSATVRQTQLSGPVDSSGYNATLSAGAALNFNVDASPTNVVLTFANGFGSGGSVDTYTVLSADASNQGSLNASNTHYISATRTSASAVTWGQYLVPPQYGYAFDRTQGALLNFEAADASTTMADDFGNTWTASGNAQIDTAQSKFGTASLLLDGTGDYIASTSFTTLGDGSWEISCWARWATLPTAGNRQELFHFVNAAGFGARLMLFNNAGTTKLETFLSSNGSSADLANGTVGSNTVWATATQYRVRFVFDALAGTYKVYLSINGAAETADISVSSSSRICAVTGARIGTDPTTTTNYMNGWIDAFRFIRAATNTSTETPGATAPAITDYPYHWFSIPEMKMYEVTSASASAGTNPGMTRKDRVFVGECDTNGASVTATRNYALRGIYESALTTITAATPSSFSHNLGVRPRQMRMRLQNQTTDAGYSPGDELSASDIDNATNAFSLSSARNTATAVSTAAWGISNKSSGARAAITLANWKQILVAQRGW